MDNLFKLVNPLEIWIPVNITYFHFSLKETAQLPKLQLFLLSAIADYNAETDVIVDATQLSKNLIEQELHDMYKQKLLEFNAEGHYQLTQLSYRLLHYDILISQMNELNSPFTFNYVTGDIKAGMNPELKEKPEGIVANKVVSIFEIDCIEPQEIKNPLLIAFPFLYDDEDDVVDDFLDNIVIEANHEKDNKWKRMYITHLPISASTAQQDELKIRCYMNQMRYKVYDSFFENHVSILKMIRDISMFDATLLNSKALDLLQRWDLYSCAKEKTENFYINPINGAVFDGEFSAINSTKSVVFDVQDFEMPDMDEAIISEKIKSYDTNGFLLKKISDEVIPYISALPVACLVDKIMERT